MKELRQHAEKNNLSIAQVIMANEVAVSGKTEEQVKHDSDRDYYMSADEAKAYGLVDEVVRSRKELPASVLAEANAVAAASRAAEAARTE